MGRVTLQDIAARVGVDRSTVSRVLSNKAAEGGISVELADRIVRQARELNYIPNTSARAVRSGRFNCAALLMSTDAGRSYLSSYMLDGVHDELASADMHLTVAKVPDEKLNDESHVPKILRTLMADGLLINYTHHLPEHLVEIVEQRQIPAVWINTRRDTDVVYPRNYEAARTATERLIAAGHRRIGYVDLCHGKNELSQAHFSAHDRLAGYAGAMVDSGLKPMDLRPEQSCFDYEHELAASIELMRRPDRPSAIVCYFTIFSSALIRAAGIAGVRIPQDLSVVTFAPEGYREQGVVFSAMLEPHHDLGCEAVRALRRKIADPKYTAPARKLDFIWQDMDTVTAPASGAANGA